MDKQKPRERKAKAAEAPRPRRIRSARLFMDVSLLLANLPNLITVARLLMTPAAVAMIVSQRYVEAFLIFILAGVSDGVDGYIAKRFDLRSELGAYLDP